MGMIRFAAIQRLSRAWMLPIAVLPVAGLLLHLVQHDWSNSLWLLPVGALYFALYCQIFRFALRKFTLMPNGLVDVPAGAVASAATVMIDPARWWVALGGASNVQAVEAVAGTRLRVELSDAARADPQALKNLGAVDVVQFSSSLLHVVLALDAGPVSRALQNASALDSDRAALTRIFNRH